ncbi:hypothetical protein HanRHA438_Chr01g0032311 [Helianthus annuus]|nr:hypothetical protein HanRHA438_Chr01g0032311 [Helianthus annuus]
MFVCFSFFAASVVGLFGLAACKAKFCFGSKNNLRLLLKKIYYRNKLCVLAGSFCFFPYDLFITF